MRLVAILSLGVLLVGPLAAAETPKPKEAKTSAAASATKAAPTEAEARTPRTAPPKTSPALEKWIGLCIQNLASEEGAVWNGAIAALRVAGPAARPQLEKAATSDNKKVAQLAGRLLAGSERQKHQAEARAERQPDESGEMSLDLKLTEEQRPKVAKIFGEYRTKQDELTLSARKGELPRDQVSSKLSILREDVDKKLATVLTAEQLKQYRDSKAAAPENPEP